jgi:hypothetical protein
MIDAPNAAALAAGPIEMAGAIPKAAAATVTTRPRTLSAAALAASRSALLTLAPLARPRAASWRGRRRSQSQSAPARSMKATMMK